jgi:hypothetical protein
MAESVQDLPPDQRRVAAQAAEAFRADDAVRLGELLDLHPFLKSLVNEPLLSFDAPPIVHVRSRAMLDVLLAAGADINARSRWWAGGFGLLDWASPEVAAYAIERGARVSVNAAARLGLVDTLRARVSADPSSVHARGGDGQTPLHVAQTVEVAQILLDAGADIDARDVDHESTPAQYLCGERVDVARHLVARGCQSDLLLAAALGDVECARRHLDSDPGAVRMRANAEWFPMRNPRAGGTIYQWTLGFHASAHQVAHDRGHTDLLELLDQRSPASVRLLDACWIGDGAAVERLLSQGSAIVDWTADEQVLIAHAARNNRTEAVRLMLECGLPVDTRGQHRATPLHWAAFHGNAEMTRAILRHGPPLELADNDFSGTPLGWAIHGSEHGWHVKTGDYASTVTLLLRAGARPPSKTGGSAAVLAVLSRETGHESR